MLSSVAERYGRRQIRPYYLMDSKAGGGGIQRTDGLAGA